MGKRPRSALYFFQVKFIWIVCRIQYLLKRVGGHIFWPVMPSRYLLLTYCTRFQCTQNIQIKDVIKITRLSSFRILENLWGRYSPSRHTSQAFGSHQTPLETKCKKKTGVGWVGRFCISGRKPSGALFPAGWSAVPPRFPDHM